MAAVELVDNGARVPLARQEAQDAVQDEFH